MTSDTISCDGGRQPWVIDAEVGQRINLIVYDFSRSDGRRFTTTVGESSGVGRLGVGDGRTSNATGGSYRIGTRLNTDVGGEMGISDAGGVMPQGGGGIATAARGKENYRRKEANVEQCVEYGRIEDRGGARLLPGGLVDEQGSEKSGIYNGKLAAGEVNDREITSDGFHQKQAAPHNHDEKTVDASVARSKAATENGGVAGEQLPVVSTDPLCGGTKRVRFAYRSLGNRLRVWITAGMGPKNMQRIIVAYEGEPCNFNN